jgi:hypothetical protein
MPIPVPRLDDRNFHDLVSELLARIPAHTDEWTNPRQGDPGHTIIELFAWLADTMLYRANLIPERQRLAFLRLLGIPMRPAIPARTLISVSIDDEDQTTATILRRQATVKGPVNFETRTEVTVLPLTAEAYYKRPLSDEEKSALLTVINNLQQIYVGSTAAQTVTPYVTTAIMAGGAPESEGFDIITRTVDQCLWLALLAAKPENVEPVRQTLGRGPGGGQQLISIGIMPSLTVPALFEDIGRRAALPHVWEITGVDASNATTYRTLDTFLDTSAGLTQRGVQRLALPSKEFIGAPTNDVRRLLQAGTGDEPPRLDDPEKATRLVAWLRLRPSKRLTSMHLSWVGINAVEVDQRQTMTRRIIGQSDGAADQVMQLPGQSVEAETLEIQVEEPGLGYRTWQHIDDLNLAGRDAAVYRLDSEAGTITFGDRVRGRVPEPASRVRVAMMRAGGGRAGNLPSGSLSTITAVDLDGTPVSRLVVAQPLPADGGEDAETLEAAERRIPDLFRHRDRAVTESDYRLLAAQTPGIQVGRVELLPRFKPQQRRPNVPGVISVMTLPYKPPADAPNPRADRPFLESVHAYLEARRPLGTELYVISCEYIPIGVSVGVEIADGFDREQVLKAARDALKMLLWPLSPGGLQGTGWQLGRTVEDRELETTVARVPGVQSLLGARLRLFRREGTTWQLVLPSTSSGQADIRLAAWQLPELLSVVVVADDGPPDNLGATGLVDGETGLPVPIVPEVCQ